MKNLTNDSKVGNMTGLLKFQRFETLTNYELGKVKGGGSGDDAPPVIIPE